jgi:hypothetical protein
MDIQKRLLEIWSSNYMNDLPELLKIRGFNYSVNNIHKDILITGINPSFRIGEIEGNSSFDFDYIAKENK